MIISIDIISSHFQSENHLYLRFSQSALICIIFMIGLALEIGTANTKIGFIGESEPRLRTQSIYLTSENQRTVNQYEEDFFLRQREERIFGNSVNVWRNDVTASKIFQQHWQDEDTQLRLLNCELQKDSYFKFLQDLIKEIIQIKEKHNSINEESTEYGLLINQPVYLKKHEISKFRETISTFVFQTLHLSALYFIKNSVSSAFSEAKSNAIVIDSGHNFTTVSRIIDGYNEKTITFNFAGNIISYELENYLKSKSLLDKTNFCISSKTRCDVFDQLCKFKEITSFKQSFKIDSNSEVEEEGEITLELPDKATIKFGRNEIIEPFTQYQDYKKISDLSFPENYYSIARSAVDLLEEDNHSNYVNSIVITGGNMQFSNLSNRVSDQIVRLMANRNMKGKNIVRSSNPLTSSWIGSSIVGSTQTFHNYWCTINEYREHGVSIINKKCPF